MFEAWQQAGNKVLRQSCLQVLSPFVFAPAPVIRADSYASCDLFALVGTPCCEFRKQMGYQGRKISRLGLTPRLFQQQSGCVTVRPLTYDVQSAANVLLAAVRTARSKPPVLGKCMMRLESGSACGKWQSWSDMRGFVRIRFDWSAEIIGLNSKGCMDCTQMCTGRDLSKLILYSVKRSSSSGKAPIGRSRVMSRNLWVTPTMKSVRKLYSLPHTKCSN